jgi:hypothetical protein
MKYYATIKVFLKDLIALEQIKMKSKHEQQAWDRAMDSVGPGIWTSWDLAKYLTIGLVFGTCIGVLVCQALS